ncbi:flagellar hook-associated protein 3 [Halobacillus andaensis]|uniref:Flagellar hook-associated protein 3 n=1 Tax=Halobacillus andaensis TaxID=1176239 RepID=A0A917BAH8_HALAA|nr:flagellar hook-associated protein FlgL [Halobacillus andaensis]MBP2005412.1 flagellar hook-associated protein 3 FlgL [Halobacillus andaensis]GGF31279.1 flagellar hook-associated protein 3 [Halobacillus andaensis]
MRVTQGMLSNNMLRNLSNSYGEMGKFQEQLSTGKKISKPSQDPVVAMKGMNYRSQVGQVEQFQRNIGEVHNWMDNSDSALDEGTQAIQRIRELNVQASNGTYSDNERADVAKEVRQLKEHLGEIANTEVNGKYIFNGENTTEKPVNMDDFTINSNDSPVELEVSSGVKLQANVTPSAVFNEDLFSDIEKFASDLENGAGEDELGSSLSQFDDHVNSFVGERADLGARMNRVELIEDRLGSQEESAKRMMSDNEDAEIEKVITDLKTQESVHRAAMGVGARVMQPSLMDFLK